ncbi:MAG: 1-acyl-sn-glycerol-3-phosphate acyltransferase [Bacteroidales bacterium]|nr:1-acyl-sn-glycerol-3-phosphate acyltransferase [Bacteroidales bacterium]
MQTDKFENIRPYNQKEVVSAMKRLIKEPDFFKVIRFILPEWSVDEIKAEAIGITSSFDFQKVFMYKTIKKIFKKSSAGFTYSGIENLQPNEAYLFIANHRDIFLDSTIFEMVLYENKIETSQITFGSNLMTSKLLIDIGKINKMFTVNRSGNKQKMYNNSVILSEYIRDTIVNKKESIWIAQRNGRTKNGYDITQTGLLKMIDISGKKDYIENFRMLNILPVSISYEYESCDIQKVREVYMSKDSVYVKEPDEDIKSIISGVVENKGRIHLSFGKPISNELNSISKIKNNNTKIKLLANEIDKQIYSNYKLWKTNYIAADILKNDKIYSKYYTDIEKKNFIDYMNSKLNTLKGNYEEIKKIFLEIYANPVFNSKINETKNKL